MLYYSIIGLYIAFYIVMIALDLLHKSPNETQPKAEEVEVDISAEAMQFKPIEISKDDPVPQSAPSPIYNKVESQQKPDSPEEKKDEAEDGPSEETRAQTQSIPTPPAPPGHEPDVSAEQEYWMNLLLNEAEPDDDTPAPEFIPVQTEAVYEPAIQEPATSTKPEPGPARAFRPESSVKSATLIRLEELKKTRYEDGILLDLLVDHIEDLSEHDPDMDTAEEEIFRIQARLP